MKLEQFKKRAKKIPDGPGVYYFLGAKREVLYIGKATSLRDRMRSYFSPDIAATRGPLIVSMVEKARSISWKEADSVLEALILEANLIHTLKPKHNTDLKDNKSWNYVVITKEDFPRVLLIRGRGLANEPLANGAPGRSAKSNHSQMARSPYQYTFGPFPHGTQLKEAMKLIRKIFPYRDTCVPPPVGGSGKPCFNRHIGLCPGVCTGEISKTEYRRIVRHITLLFQGKKKILIKTLEREMKVAAKKEKFEEAVQLRRQLFALNHIQDVSLIKEEYRKPSMNLGVTRIEAYDMAHLQGSANVGVMTVVEDGVAQKNEYRKFKIRSATPGDDVGALREVLSRRLAHDEWPWPTLIVVDGSTAQLNAAEKILREHSMTIPVVGVVKDEKHRPRNIIGSRALIKDRERDILLANAEAHRFAINYHRKTYRVV